MADKGMQTGPPGTPQGKHDPKMKDACRCGRCSNNLLDWPKPVIVEMKVPRR